MFHRKTILQNTLKVGFLTQLSRFLGLARDLLIAQYLGVGTYSDAFITAFKVPNSLRKVFAEGALSATLIPAIVKASQKDKTFAINKLISGAFFFFEGLCLFFVVLGMSQSTIIVHYIASGFSEEQQLITSKLLFILMPYILFVSTAYLFGSFLQAQGYFLIPAAGPVIANVLFLLILGSCFYFHFSIYTFCTLIVISAIIQCLINITACFSCKFSIEKPDETAKKQLQKVAKQFLLCLPSISFSEINLFIDTSFASNLEAGSISLLYYANRFMGIPLGVLVGSLMTVLLPELSHVALKSSRRLSFYIFESMKLILWVTIPVMIVMILCSYPLFYTLFFSKKFSIEQVKIASTVLQMFCLGLPALSLNRLLLNVLYALHATAAPAIISLAAVGVNIICNYILLYKLKIIGLALATSISAFVQLFLFIIIVRSYNCILYGKKLAVFLIHYMIQLTVVGIPIFILYNFTLRTVSVFFVSFEHAGWEFWLLAGSFSLLFCVCVFLSRKHAGFHSFFID